MKTLALVGLAIAWRKRRSVREKSETPHKKSDAEFLAEAVVGKALALQAIVQKHPGRIPHPDFYSRTLPPTLAAAAKLQTALDLLYSELGMGGGISPSSIVMQAQAHIRAGT